MAAESMPMAMAMTDSQERTRRTVVNLVLTTYFLLVVECALRKWALESLHQALFFIRDPFVLLSLWLCLRERLLTWTLLTTVVALLATAFLFLGGMHIIIQNLNPIAAVFGWRNYFYYLIFALIMAAVMRRDDVERMIRLSLWMAIPMAVLAF
ncbi:MAG TPA: hypothetical protein VHX44_05490, partial [Planctomycetota bacterium]|nr:hypothetical protein [Planctomycetota bacterium]